MKSWRRRAPIALGSILAVCGAALEAANSLAGAAAAPRAVTIPLIAAGGLIAIGNVAASRYSAWRREERERRRLLHGAVRPGRVRELDMYGVGVTRSAVAESLRSDPGRDSAPPYVPRAIDDALRDALRRARFVVVSGRSKAGKSRTAFEMLREVSPDAWLTVPASTTAIEAIAQHGVTTEGETRIWLDDLNDYLDRGALTTAVIGSLLDDPNVAVVATLRSSERDRFLNARGPTARDARDVLQQAVEVELPTLLDANEARDAARLYPGGDFSQGVGTFFTSVEELIEKYQGGLDSAPIGTGLVMAAVDWRRVGITRVVSRAELVELLPLYLPGALLSEEVVSAGLEWANAPVSSSVRLLDATEGRDPYFRAIDPILDYDDRVREIPEEAWKRVLNMCSPEEASDMFLPAKTRGLIRVAEEIAAKAMLSTDPSKRLFAMARLGMVKHELGELEEAERLYREPAEGGYLPAMVNLGAILIESEPEEGARWLRTAAEAGDPRGLGALNYAGVCEQQGRLEEAREWYAKAAAAGNMPALVRLASFLENDDPDEAERLLRKAAAPSTDPLADHPFVTGGVDPKFELGRFLIGRDDREAAEWLERSEASGNAWAGFLLGVLARDQGRADEALTRFRAAADAGLPEGAQEIAGALAEARKSEEAEAWLRQAADAGLHTSAARLADLLVRAERFDEAEAYARQAAGAGVPMGMFYLGTILYGRGDTDGALRAWIQAAEKGDQPSMFNAGRVFQERGQLPSAEFWYRKAIEAGAEGMAAAAHNLGTVLWDMHQDAEAAAWLARAGEHDNPDAFSDTAYGLMLFGRGDYEAAKARFDRVSDSGYRNVEIYRQLLFADQTSDPEGEGRLRARAELGDPDAAYGMALISMGRGQYLVGRYWMERANQERTLVIPIWRPS